MKNISILIPTFNDACLKLVTDLHKQAERISETAGGTFEYEILVGDDGSTDTSIIGENERINSLSRCRYIRRERNEGRSAIRNFLASQARYDYLLFIDSDMTVRSDAYLATYVEAPDSDVIYGGYVVNGDYDKLKHNLRYLYECRNKTNNNAEERRKQPYKDFHTSNFLVRKSLFTACPLDVRFRKYGYEDILWGKNLKGKNIRIEHINNTLSMEKYESNDSFVAKTEVAMATLHKFRDELRGYSNVIATAETISRRHLKPLFCALFKSFRAYVKRCITSNKPSVFLFNIYKLGLYIMEDKK